MRVLLNSRSTGNYVDARECTARRIKIEAEDEVEELKMADGIVAQTEGRVQFVLKCGGYREQISARIFPNMNKPMILGIPWLLKENPHIDWTQAIVVVNKEHQWISLPLAKPLQSNPVHLASEISASQVNHMLKKKEVERAFQGLSDWSKRNQRAWMHQRSPQLRRSQSGIRHFHHQSVRSLRNLLMFFLRTSHLEFLQSARGMNLKSIWRMRCPQSIAHCTR